MTYDNFGRKISMDDPDMGVWSYAYDALAECVNDFETPKLIN
jgi:hypothetical protein